MTKRKIPIDNSVKYNPEGDQTREIIQNTIRINQLPEKTLKIFHKTIKKSLLRWQHKDLVSL